MRRAIAVLLAAIYLLADVQAATKHFLNSDDLMHTHMHTHYDSKPKMQQRKYDDAEETAAFWNDKAEETLKKLLDHKYNTNKAKNVIMFLGDGMSIPTLAATRVYLGQKNGKTGEETVLSFEEFPHTALSKTYCVDGTVADSACSATAYLGGVKANDGTIGVTAAVKLRDCDAMIDEYNHVFSVAKLFQDKGLRTGVVTTTRITHASPAGVYAHTAFRDWECDANIAADGEDPEDCPDIAKQLVYGKVGSKLNVIFGGGRWAFLSENQTDVDNLPGLRLDDRDLIQEWNDTKQARNVSSDVIFYRENLTKLDVEKTDYVLGLFANDHLNYRLDLNMSQPRLIDMTKKAIELLSKDKKGFFLFVEGGRIDHAHHDTMPRKALEETVEFHYAIQAAVEMVNISETLIVVTADHAHTMSVSGYPQRGNDILGFAAEAEDGLPYTTISYANGPGYKKEAGGDRYDLTKDKIGDKNYKFPGLVPLKEETHGGDDVGIYAIGPWSHLFAGVMEQNVIPHIMAYASCVRDDVRNACSASTRSVAALSLLLLPLFVVFSRNAS